MHDAGLRVEPEPRLFSVEMHKTALTGIGGIVAMFTLERFNVFLGTVAGLLTITHLSIQIFKALRGKR